MVSELPTPIGPRLSQTLLLLACVGNLWHGRTAWGFPSCPEIESKWGSMNGGTQVQYPKGWFISWKILHDLEVPKIIGNLEVSDVYWCRLEICPETELTKRKAQFPVPHHGPLIPIPRKTLMECLARIIMSVAPWNLVSDLPLCKNIGQVEWLLWLFPIYGKII